MAEKGYVFTLIVGVKPGAEERDRIRLGTTGHYLDDPTLVGPTIRLLRDVADMLEKNPRAGSWPIIEVPE